MLPNSSRGTILRNPLITIPIASLLIVQRSQGLTSGFATRIKKRSFAGDGAPYFSSSGRAEARRSTQATPTSCVGQLGPWYDWRQRPKADCRGRAAIQSCGRLLNCVSCLNKRKKRIFRPFAAPRYFIIFFTPSTTLLFWSGCVETRHTLNSRVAATTITH